jgi:soluble lytic murein transglycosylase-like protein
VPRLELASHAARIGGAAQRAFVAAACAAACAWALPLHAQDVPQDARSGADPKLRSILESAVAEATSFRDRFDAEVWLVDMSRRLERQVPNPEERIEILKAVHHHATSASLEPELVLAVIDVESNFERFAISSARAFGLMQVMPFWVKELGDEPPSRLFEIDFNVLLGCYILKYYVDMERGNVMRGLARYNGSLGQTWYSDRVLQRLRTKWFRG